MKWFKIADGYYGVAQQQVTATGPASKIVDEAFASAFALSSEEARELFDRTSYGSATTSSAYRRSTTT